ncbi:MAG: S9 family peptidase [Clostridiaceae bacterium]|nr:S9 family peptidase [Clostridiaceae bacterium]
MKKIDIEDIYSFSFLSDIVASPDEKHLVFSRHTACRETNGYMSCLWLMDVDSGKARQLTFEGGERGAKWLDSESIVFAANRGNISKTPKTDFFKLSIKGGEALPLLSIPEKAAGIDFIGGDKYLVSLVKHCEGAEKKSDDEAMDGRDLLVFDEVYFWFNGLGICNKIRNSLAIYDAKFGEYKQITPKYFNTSAYVISPDKTKVAYAGAEYKDLFTNKSGLYIYDIPTGETKTLLPQGQKLTGSICFAGDNRVFGALNDGDYSGQNSRFFLFDLEGGVTALPFVDAEAGGGVGTDCNYGGGQNRKFYGGRLYMTRNVRGDCHLCAMDISSGRDSVVTKECGSVNSFDMAGGKAYMVALRGMCLGEIYALDPATGVEQQLTSFNKEYCGSHEIAMPETFTFVNKDGVELDGYVIKPIGYKKGKKYPAVLEIHGGPKTIFGSVFHHEMQVLANRGFFVFYTNPRGSDGRGEKFAYSTKFLGTKDYEDLMEFTDVVLHRYPDIDAKRVGVTGGSYGGYMCNWIIGHTNRFRAAASQRSISNYVTKLTATDIGTTYDLQQVGASPWESFETVWETSPLKYAHRASTPTLFIQSDEDYRCWMSGALQMFSALKMNGTDSRLALFHGENHELSRSGKPDNRVKRLCEIVGWMEKYLK